MSFALGPPVEVDELREDELDPALLHRRADRVERGRVGAHRAPSCSVSGSYHGSPSPTAPPARATDPCQPRRQAPRARQRRRRPTPRCHARPGRYAPSAPSAVVDAEVERRRGAAIDPRHVADPELRRRHAREHRRRDAREAEHDQRQHVRQRQEHARSRRRAPCRTRRGASRPARRAARQRRRHARQPEQEDEAGGGDRVRERRLLEPEDDVREGADEREEQRARRRSRRRSGGGCGGGARCRRRGEAGPAPAGRSASRSQRRGGSRASTPIATRQPTTALASATPSRPISPPTTSADT